MPRLRTASVAAVLAAAVGFVTTTPAAPPGPVGPNPDDTPARLFAWFDTLGYPDLAVARFVRVQYDGGPSDDQDDFEFLLADDEATFTTLSLGTLSPRTYEKPLPGFPAKRRANFVEQNLVTHIDERIRFANDGITDRSRQSAGYDQPFVLRAQLFVLARAAQFRGLDESVRRLLDAVARLPEPSWNDAPPARTVHLRLVNDFAYAETWLAIRDLDDFRVPRARIAPKLDRVISLYPQFVRHVEVVDAVVRLRRMIRQEEERATRGDEPPLEQRSVDDQIAYWIFQFRESTSQLDTCGYAGGRAIMLEDGPVRSAALFDWSAVPQLTEALDDDGFVRRAKNYAGAKLDWPATIGDAAETALGYIAGRTFDLPALDGDRSTPAEQLAAKKKLIRAWYCDVRNRGLKAVLIDGTRSGADYAADQGTRLADLFPDEAAAPIMEGATKSRSPDVRGGLVELLDDLPGDDVRQFLRNEAEFGPFLVSSMAAASVLDEWGDDAWKPLIVRRWYEATRGPIPDPLAVIGRDRNAAEFADFLINSGDPQLVRAIAARMRSLPIQLRSQIIFDLGKKLRILDASGPSKSEPGYVEAIYELLLRSLDDDREQASNLLFGQLREPRRVCDIVGMALRRVNSDRYPFDVDANRSRRDLALAAVRSALRPDCGLSPETVGVQRPRPRLPTAVTPD